jgi:hypothetical protein
MKLTQRTLNPNNLTLADLMHIVSVADTSQGPAGSSYKETLSKVAALMRLSGMGNWRTGAPTASNDVTQGYINGAFWYDENANVLYILNDNSAGAADWVKVNASKKGTHTPVFTGETNGTASVIKNLEWQEIDGVVTCRVALRFDFDVAETQGSFEFNLGSAEPTAVFASRVDVVGGFNDSGAIEYRLGFGCATTTKKIQVTIKGDAAGGSCEFGLLFQFNR